MINPIRTLLVDDEETFWKPMQQQLIQAGLYVDVATSGKKALAMVKACEGDYQVAVIDQVMGPPNGTNIMITLRQLYPSIEAIILTGWGDMEPGEEAMELGAFRYLSKPVNIRELVLNIRFAARFGQERKKSLSLQKLVSAGQRIGGAQSEKELYQQIYLVVGNLLPGLGGFVISQYDESQDVLNFPFCFCRGKPIKMASRKQGNGLTEFVIKNREPLLLSGSDEEFRKMQKIDPPDPRLGYKKSEIVAPLFLDKRIIGTINALTFNNTYFAPEHLQIFQAFANQAALAISSVQQLVEAEQLKDAVSALAGKRGRKAVLMAIVKEANKLIDCDFTGLILQDENGTLRRVRPVIPASYYRRFDEPRQQGGITRAVVESRKPMVIRDTLNNPLVKKIVHEEGIRSMLAFPLCYGNIVLGVLYGHSLSTRYFSAHDVELWTTFATQAAVVLYSSIEEEQRAEDFKRLEEVTTALKGTKDVHATMSKVATAAQNVFKSNTCRLALVEPTTLRIVNWMWAKNDPKDYRIEDAPRPNGFTNHVLQTKKPVFHAVNDPNNPQPIQELERKGLKYTLSLPLLISGRVVGVLHCNYLDKQEPIYDHLRDLIPAFSTRAAIALNRARHDRFTGIWHDLDQKIVFCNDLQDLYKVFVNHAHRALRADFSIFYPFDPTRIAEISKTIRDDIVLEGDLHTSWRIPEGGQGGGVVRALAEGPDGLLIINDLDSCQGKYASQLAIREGIKAFVAIRLKVILPENKFPKTAGILFLNFRTPTAFEQRDLVDLQSAGASVAQGILRLNLESALQKAFEERNNLLRAVTDILRAFEREGKGLNPNLIAEHAVKALGIDTCTLMEYDHNREMFLRRGIAGVLHPDTHYTIPNEFKARFMDATGPTVITNLQEDKLFQSSRYIQREGIKSAAIFPLHIEGDPIGLLIADYRNPVSLPKEKMEALSLFAEFAALVLHESQLNAKLSEIQKKLSRRIFLDWVSMIEASWRHSLVQRAATIRNHTAILKRQLDNASRLPEAMNDVPTAIAKIDQLATEIADAPPRVPQSWELEPELVPLAPLLEEVAKRENPQPHTDTIPLVQVEFDIEPLGGLQVRGYRRWLIYALEALLQNARRAMPLGGTVTIIGRQTAQWIEVRIQDTGIGIPKVIQNKLFKELIPSKNDKQGMGIGSLLVATIIEMHDGEVSLEKPGPEDTTILIRLPYV